MIFTTIYMYIYTHFFFLFLFNYSRPRSRTEGDLVREATCTFARGTQVEANEMIVSEKRSQMNVCPRQSWLRLIHSR